ncbi:hypothetical protein ACIBP6_41910 [Nonomuraea terrae]
MDGSESLRRVVSAVMTGCGLMPGHDRMTQLRTVSGRDLIAGRMVGLANI